MDDITRYLNQLSSQLSSYLMPTLYLSDRLYEINEICGYRDATVDFDVGDLTTDGDWHSLDLSSIVGKHETLVKLFVQVNDGAVDSSIRFRPYGSTNFMGVCRTQVIDVYNDAHIECKTDSEGVIEYKASDVTFTAINITVTGWHPIYLIGG